MSNERGIAPINEDLNVEKYEVENIKNLIYNIRGKQVMIDSDVAMLYHYETKKINQAVRRNIDRFPERFCFQLTEKEVRENWSQIVTSSDKEEIKHRGKKYLPLAFTEQGIAMLSGVLHSEKAVEVSVNVRIYTKQNTKLSLRDINKFNSQYPKLEIKYTDKFHDRFLIIDEMLIYHIGASIKDAGKKCFGITLIKYDAIIKDILGKI